jgi:hypothetical protein
MPQTESAPLLPSLAPPWLGAAKAAIVKVGRGGRGFLVENVRGECVVLTAAHCLPRLPRMRPLEDVPYRNLLGPLGRRAPTVSAQCVFADPISDLAVLAEPDNQSMPAEADAFLQLTDDRPKLRLGAIAEPCDGWLLGLNGEWERCAILVDALNRWRSVAVENAAPNAIAPGTSGSPILTATGEAIGVVSLGPHMNPRVALELPVWLVPSLLRERGR